MSTQTNLMEATFAPTKARDGALVIFPNGSRGTIPIDQLTDAIAALQAIQANLAREDCFRMAGIDGDFQKEPI